ncbi:NADH-quinone oxidoreductase subunit L [Candidatus Sumerlaeota bacterium]|nr:NADH-quinone oxidoreductase subunit L [Candidatus Sumerlaeota bacterium]
MDFLPALIPVLPLLAFAVIITNGRRLGWSACLVAVGASLTSAVLAALVYSRVLLSHETLAWSFEWVRWGETALRMGVRIDGLGALMLFMVTVVGTLIEIYAIGYMAGDKTFSRFFAFVSLFMAGMLGLVVADNLLLLFVSWEIMGLCSYFLIGFYFHRPSAAAAGIKAFITTRIGDVGLLIGMILLWWTAGTLRFDELLLAVPALAGLGDAHVDLMLTAAALLIFVGTIGKSAQFPLHVWLPDAMEGPTPVSALIHAATMVAAGVFLVARSFILFAQFPAALTVVAWVGGFTALFAALIALTQNDIKRVLAYSTLSQLGYMVMALGLGAYAAGMFHLITHAFFKALLFMGAGAVIHGFHHVQDMRRMGGLWGKMPWTAWTFLVATLAISGIPPLSGFWSKDEILLGAFHESPVLWVAGTFTAFLTAFYMFRLFFMTFTGRQRDGEIHAHESPAVMILPLVVLAVGAALLGIPGSPWMGLWVQHSLDVPAYALAHHHHSNLVMGLSIAVAVAGIALAWLMYAPRPTIQPARVARAMGRLYTLSLNKFHIDEIYAALIINPTRALARGSFRFDLGLIDGAVNGMGWLQRALASLKGLFDKWVVDGIVNLLATIVQALSAVFGLIQTGRVHNYLLLASLGALVIACLTWWNMG